MGVVKLAYGANVMAMYVVKQGKEELVTYVNNLDCQILYSKLWYLME